jgi:hypothetical protein
LASVQYLRLHTGADGQSHFSDEVFSLGTIGAELADPVLGSQLRPASQYGVRVVPSGWERDWGPAAHPILAVYLTGEGEIEASDGEVRRISPGLVLLAEDTTGPGHRVRVTSEEPVTVVQVHLPTE